jgi:ribosomal protein S18 acetylase RimI-like enzyme
VSTLTQLTIRPFDHADEKAVIELWRRCDLLRPWNDPHKDIARKLKVRPDLFLVGLLDARIIASVMAGYDGHRAWLNYVAVDPDFRRRGFGRAIMEHTVRLLREQGAPKINLQVRSSNREAVEFYRSVGFIVDDVLSMGRRLENDEPTPK